MFFPQVQQIVESAVEQNACVRRKEILEFIILMALKENLVFSLYFCQNVATMWDRIVRKR